MSITQHPTEPVLGRSTGEAPTAAPTDEATISTHASVQQLVARSSHQRFVFTDPVAFRYLEEDSSTTVLERRSRLDGYELYIVEQWACSRSHPTFVITTFTGDPSHSVSVGVLSVPTDETSWSPRLRVYFKAVAQFHARRTETPLGTLMVTNLSSFPSALTVIAVPEGDVRKHREDFIVNENLKRLSCSGRAGLSLSAPTDATRAKFHELYKTSDQVPLHKAVIELIKQCQVALTMFDKLRVEYADGLLCDVTEGAINDWWSDIGTDIYNVEPNDGILGPSTVAALLGNLMGARSRLNAYGAPVAKDAFEITSLKRGIAYFQRSQKLIRTRRLDRQTLDRLHRVTAKAANGDGWMVRKAVKSTVAELSGKGGDMVMGMVGARDKATIAEIETTDFETFVNLIYGDRARWLWYGKSRKYNSTEGFAETPSDAQVSVFGKDEQSEYAWAGTKRASFDKSAATDRRDGVEGSLDQAVYSGRPPDSSTSLDSAGEREPQMRRTVLKSVTGKMTDARSGFERIKDAVGITGLRGHHQKHCKEELPRQDLTGNSPGRSAQADDDAILGNAQVESLSRLPSRCTSEERRLEGEKLTPRSTLEARAPQQSITPSPESKLHLDTTGRRSSTNSVDSSRDNRARADDPSDLDETPNNIQDGLAPTGHSSFKKPEAAPFQSIIRSELPCLHDDEANGPRAAIGPLLSRTRSFSRFLQRRDDQRHPSAWPRHLSFSDVEEAVLPWHDVGSSDNEGSHGPESGVHDFVREKANVYRAKQLRQKIYELQIQVGQWVEERLASVEELDGQAENDQEELSVVYHHQLDDYQATRESSNAIFAEERINLTEAVKEIEILDAKLEYELSALGAKVEDVENGVAEFERQVLAVEARAQELEAGERTPEGWLHWTWRLLPGRPINSAVRVT
ncbi:MAG: hypothetical protein M1817_000356 [Caeruleum heppii]|nr:MAG: hypothetical protein M1817_000356 [Caeruleum heppii]